MRKLFCESLLILWLKKRNSLFVVSQAARNDRTRAQRVFSLFQGKARKVNTPEKSQELAFCLSESFKTKSKILKDATEIRHESFLNYSEKAEGGYSKQVETRYSFKAARYVSACSKE